MTDKLRHGLTEAEMQEYARLTTAALTVLSNAEIGRVGELRALAERRCWAQVRGRMLGREAAIVELPPKEISDAMRRGEVYAKLSACIDEISELEIASPEDLVFCLRVLADDIEETSEGRDLTASEREAIRLNARGEDVFCGTTRDARKIARDACDASAEWSQDAIEEAERIAERAWATSRPRAENGARS